MTSAYMKQAVLYGMRPTIGQSWDLSATAIASHVAIKKPGLYLIVNHGPDPVNLKMLKEGTTDEVDLNDFVLYPAGSGDRCEVEVLITPTTKNNFVVGPNNVHGICAFGKTATVRITRMTRHS